MTHQTQRTSVERSFLGIGALVVLMGVAACAQILGIDQFVDGICNPRSERKCYSGPPGTEGTGICKAGKQVCASDGQSWSLCEGDVTPESSDNCANDVDDDCNGKVNDGCACEPEAVVACYSGDPATMGKGMCKAGTQTCDKKGAGYGACVGEKTPGVETCGSTEDEDCDGQECLISVGGFDGTVSAVASSPDGAVIVAGAVTTAPAQFGSGTLTATGPFVAKLKADRTLAWQAQLGASVITTDSAGNVYGAGNAAAVTTIGSTVIPVSQYVVKLDPDGNLIWVKSIAGLSGNGSFSVYGGPTSIAASPDGDVVLAGVFGQTSIDVGDGPVPLVGNLATAYVTKLSGQDGSGTMSTSGSRWTLTFPAYKHGYVWVGPFAGVSATGALSVVLNVAGATSLGGVMLTPGAIGLVRMTPTASVDGSWSLSASESQLALSGAVAADGTVVLTGSFVGTLDMSQWPGATPIVGKSTLPPLPSTSEIYGDGFVVAANGNSLRLAKGFDTAGHATGAMLDPDGGIVVTGTFTGVASLGGGNLDAGQGTAIVVAKFRQDGSLFWNRSFTHPLENGPMPRLAVSSGGMTWLAGYSGVWPLDFGTGPLNTAAKPSVGFVAQFAP